MRIFIPLLLQLAMAAPANLSAEPAGIASSQSHFAQSSAPRKNGEITPGCVMVPLSTTPVGPAWAFEVNTSGGSTAPAVVRGTFWRKPCAINGDGQLLLTFSAVSGNPFVCGGLRVVLIQNLQQTNSVYLDTDPNNDTVDSFCATLFVPTTVILNEDSSAFTFDDDAPFTFVYLGGTSASPNASVSVGAYDPASYGLPGALVPIIGSLSGSYYDPARNGEGVLIEVGQLGARRVFFLTWYTYANGLQRWLFGNIDYPLGATEINLPLLISSGGLFGAAFNPSQVQLSSWGNARIVFPSCTTMRFEWSENGGGSGIYDYQRLVDGLEGVVCP